MNPDTHGLAGAYAVDAVTDDERASFEAHLDQCSDCRAEVAELRAAAATLAIDVELPPPPALRSSILSAVAQTRQLSPTGDAVVDELAARRPRPRRLMAWGAAAAAAAVLAVGGLAWQPWDEPAQLTATEQVLRADDAQRMELPMGASEITLVRSPSVGRAVLLADAMPAPPAGKAYQLWLDMPGQGMVSAGLIPTSGRSVTVSLEGDARAATGAGITLEPAAGSTQPTTDPVALFSFT